MRGRTLAGFAVGVAALALPLPAEAKLHWGPCAGHRVQCARLSVPLDRSGAVSGSVSLKVARAPAFRGAQGQEGVTLVLAGNPGEAAADQVNGEYASDLVDTLSQVPGNRVVAFDQRGTGGSGVLRCRDLEAAAPTDAGREAEACATLLGARRGFYRTADTVADIEALRAELEVDRLTIVASGYGAYVAQRYALAYPERVERLLLDSPVDAAGADPLMRDSLAAARRVLGLVCRTGCGAFTQDPVADTARLTDRMAGGPLRGYAVGGDGGRRPATITPQELLFTIGGGDLNVFTRSDYPAAVVSALRGDTAPLFRLARRAVRTARSAPAADSSAATRAAVVCEEVRFPWSWRADPAERAAGTDGAAALVTAELARPFGVAAATHSDLMGLCRRWPTVSAQPPADPGAMPDVPVLVVAGDTSIRAPLETAQRVAARFPRSRLLLSPLLYGTPLTSSSSCVSRAVKRFFAGESVTSRCRGRGVVLPPGRPLPDSLERLRPVRGVAGRRGRVLRAVELTFSDWVDDISASAFASGNPRRFRGVGLRGGRYAVGPRTAVVVRRFEFIPGVRLSIDAPKIGKSYPLRVDGPGRLDGRLAIRDAGSDQDPDYFVRGRLGGRSVHARLTLSSRLLDAFRLGPGR